MRRLIAAMLLLAAGCASLRTPQEALEARVGAIPERRGLGSEALLVIDNLLRHGPPADAALPAFLRRIPPQDDTF